MIIQNSENYCLINPIDLVHDTRETFLDIHYLVDTRSCFSKIINRINTIFPTMTFPKELNSRWIPWKIWFYFFNLSLLYTYKFTICVPHMLRASIFMSCFKILLTTAVFSGFYLCLISMRLFHFAKIFFRLHLLVPSILWKNIFKCNNICNKSNYARCTCPPHCSIQINTQLLNFENVVQWKG